MTRRRVLVALLLVMVPSVLLAAWALGTVSPTAARQTLLGIAVTTAGGLVTGVTALRLLGRGSTGIKQLIGSVLTICLSVVTVGILYLGIVRGPVSSIRATERAVRQVLPFVHFLTAQGAGMLLAGERSPGAKLV